MLTTLPPLFSVWIITLVFFTILLVLASQQAVRSWERSGAPARTTQWSILAAVVLSWYPAKILMNALGELGMERDSLPLFGIFVLYVGFTISQMFIRLMARQENTEIKFYTWKDTLESCFEFLAIDEERGED